MIRIDRAASDDLDFMLWVEGFFSPGARFCEVFNLWVAPQHRRDRACQPHKRAV